MAANRGLVALVALAVLVWSVAFAGGATVAVLSASVDMTTTFETPDELREINESSESEFAVAIAPVENGTTVTGENGTAPAANGTETEGNATMPPTDGNASVPPTDENATMPPTDENATVPPTDGNASVPPTDGTEIEQNASAPSTDETDSAPATNDTETNENNSAPTEENGSAPADDNDTGTEENDAAPTDPTREQSDPSSEETVTNESAPSGSGHGA